MTENTAEPSALWEADASHPELAEEIRAGLRQVIDPELGLSIIELGLVREVKINDDKLDLMMILTTPFCPSPTTTSSSLCKSGIRSANPTRPWLAGR